MPKSRQTCTECSMRRQKCDREIPCGRCVKRGEANSCTREWPGEYDPKLHRIYPRQQDATKTPSLRNGEGPKNSGTEDSIQSLSPVLQTTGMSLDGRAKAKSYTLNLPMPPDLWDLETPSPAKASSQQESRPPADIENAASVLEFLAWGKAKLSEYDIKAPELLKEAWRGANPTSNSSEWDFAHGFGGTGAAQMSFLQLLLPSRKQIFQLVEYHSQCILWYHSSYHAPTFWKELQEVHQAPAGLQIRDMDLRWTALLFSVMAASMTCASDSKAISWGFQKAERAKLTRQWYKATISCLQLGDYMSKHHHYSVEAILTLTMSSHILGFSNNQSVLLGSALKISQTLGLQRLGPDVSDGIASDSMGLTTSTQREKALRREMGRRMWSQLCIQDWFSIPFSEMYSIHHIHFSTIKPLNCDDETMMVLPPEVPTSTSFGNFLFEIANVMPQLHDAVSTSNTLYTKYEQILKYDTQMRALATEGLPAYFSMREAIDVNWPQWIPWARRSITICFAHKIIMIHRTFLGRSFTDSAFAFTRRTCMAAAKTILKEARQAYDEEGPLLWIDQAFMVAAGITLSLDLFHRTEQEPELEEHRKLVENTINMLQKFENSMIAARGIRMLSSLLSEYGRISAEQAVETRRKRDRSDEGDGREGKRQKFDVPKFVESFCGDYSFTRSLGYSEPPTSGAAQDVSTGSEPPNPPEPPYVPPDLNYEMFAELFPPQTGISNAFLFEDLLNFDVF